MQCTVELIKSLKFAVGKSRIVFELPDIVADYDLKNGFKCHLHGYKDKLNDAIFASKGPYYQLRWVAVGCPKLEVMQVPLKPKLKEHLKTELNIVRNNDRNLKEGNKIVQEETDKDRSDDNVQKETEKYRGDDNVQEKSEKDQSDDTATNNQEDPIEENEESAQNKDNYNVQEEQNSSDNEAESDNSKSRIKRSSNLKGKKLNTTRVSNTTFSQITNKANKTNNNKRAKTVRILKRFLPRNDGIQFSMIMLTPDQREHLRRSVARKYGLKVDSMQIVQLTPARLQCRVDLYSYLGMYY